MLTNTSKEPTITTCRPKILLIVDVPNWIFAKHCHYFIQKLSHNFNFDIKTAGEEFDEASYSLIYPLEWNLVRIDNIKTPGKYVTGIRSHTSWSTIDFFAFTQIINSKFQRVHVVSERLLNIFRPFVPSVIYLTHGTDTDLFQSSSTRTSRLPGTIRLGWAGNRGTPTKGFDQFVAPLGRLPGVQLAVCGFRDKNLDRREMIDFYNNIDVYVCASQQEGNNNSLLEAAAMNCAIITTDSGTVPEYLKNEESALIVERDLPLFIEAVCRLRDNPSLRHSLGSAARRAVVSKFDWNRIIYDYETFFYESIQRSLNWAPDTVALWNSIRIKE